MALRSILSRFRRAFESKTSSTGALSLQTRRFEDVQWISECIMPPCDYQSNSMVGEEDLEKHLSSIISQRVLTFFEMLEKGCRPGYALESRNSTLGTDAGDGLFATSTSKTIKPGEIVALYPGTVFYAEELDFFGGVQSIFQEDETSHFIVSNTDGILIDGLGKTLPLNHNSQGGFTLIPADGGDMDSVLMDFLARIETLKSKMVHRPHSSSTNSLGSFALAHKANHPPFGTPANVVPVSVNFDLHEMKMKRPHLLNYVPTSYALQTISDADLLSEHTICFVASRQICGGEEIWLDYRTSPGARPPWYHDAVRPPYM